MQNEYQDRIEPSGQETWYSSFISAAISPPRQESTLNRYKNKINIVTATGTRVIEFIKKSQLYIEPSEGDQFYFVDASKRYRPDIIANEVYGNPQLYWVILACNNLSHALQVKTNMTLRIPQLSTILQDERVL